VFRDGVALGDDGSSLCSVDDSGVDITQLVGRLVLPAGGYAGEERGGDVAQRGVVVLSASTISRWYFAARVGS